MIAAHRPAMQRTGLGKSPRMSRTIPSTAVCHIDQRYQAASRHPPRFIRHHCRCPFADVDASQSYSGAPNSSLFDGVIARPQVGRIDHAQPLPQVIAILLSRNSPLRKGSMILLPAIALRLCSRYPCGSLNRGSQFPSLKPPCHPHATAAFGCPIDAAGRRPYPMKSDRVERSGDPRVRKCYRSKGLFNRIILPCCSISIGFALSSAVPGPGVCALLLSYLPTLPVSPIRSTIPLRAANLRRSCPRQVGRR